MVLGQFTWTQDGNLKSVAFGSEQWGASAVRFEYGSQVNKLGMPIFTFDCIPVPIFSFCSMTYDVPFSAANFPTSVWCDDKLVFRIEYELNPDGSIAVERRNGTQEVTYRYTYSTL